MMKRLCFGVVCCLAVLFCGQVAFGQATGSFSGTVTDKSGAPVNGATVTVTSQATGATREGKSNDTGYYVINLLPVSVYTVHVEFQGFQKAESRDVKLQVDEHRELNFVLSPASVSASVEVVASAVSVETASPSLGQVITSEEVADLPLNGRDFVQLATLTPGTTQETNTGSFFNGGPSSEVSARGSYSLSVGGSRANSTDWLLDGNDNNELTAGGIGILSSIDSIQEFKVLTYNFSAEFGTRAGPAVLVTTKSGGNEFHGSIFEFLRNTALDAKSFYATTPEKFNLNQFGGAVGGPIRKNKTFFFADSEQKYQLHGTTFNGLVPTAAMRNGDFSADPFGAAQTGIVIANPNMSGAANANFQCDTTAAHNPMPVLSNQSQAAGVDCNKIPAGLFNPIGQALINLYPLPNANDPVHGVNFINEPVRSLNETKFDVRLDNNFSSADSLFTRFSYDQATSYVPGGSSGFSEANAFASNQGIINHGRNVSIGETHVFSPTTVNQVTAGYNRIFNYINSQGTGSCISKTIGGGIPGANIGGSSCGLTSISISGGYWSLGDRGYTPFQGGTNVFTIADSFDMIRGKHDVKVGGQVRDNQMNVRAVGFQDGFWVLGGAWTSNGFTLPGSPMADMLMGLSSLRIHDQNFNGDITGRRWKLYRPFVQDDWRVTKDLTLNLGVAWAMATPVTEAGNRMANLDLATGQLLIPGQNGVGASAGIKMDWTAIEPRLGAAWKVHGSDKTVIRGGYAMYHDSAWSMGAQGLWQNPPYAAESFGISFGGCTTVTAYCASHGGTPNIGTGQAVGFSDGFPLITTPPSVSTFGGNFTTENTNIKQGRVQQFNVNFERQLPGGIVLTAGYAGSRSSHILNYGNNINLSAPAACAGGPAPVAGYTLGCGSGGAYFPNPYLASYNTIYSINDLGKASYNSVQIKAETKSSKYGIYALVGYTYSKTYDTGFSDGLGTGLGVPYYPLPGWQTLDWGLSQINLNNNFTASVIYDMPFGKGKKYGSSWNSTTNALLGNWQVTVIEKVTSGFPIFLIDSNNSSGVSFNNNGNSYNRPVQISNPFVPGVVTANPNPLCQKLVSAGGYAPDTLSASGAWFNGCAFTSPPSGELGTTPRAPFSGPDFVNTDFSLIKRFALPWEKTGIDFRAEIFNLFNHAQFGLPNTDVNSPSAFGRNSSTVNNPRLVQLGLKFTF